MISSSSEIARTRFFCLLTSPLLPHSPFLLISSRASLVLNTSAALPHAARLLPAMRQQPPASEIHFCAASARIDDALREKNKKTFEGLLAGDAAALQGLRVLVLSDSTDYNALAYAGRFRCHGSRSVAQKAALDVFCPSSARSSHSLSALLFLQTATCACACQRALARAHSQVFDTASRVILQCSYHRFDPPDACSPATSAYASGSDRCDHGRVASLHFPKANFTWTV